MQAPCYTRRMTGSNTPAPETPEGRAALQLAAWIAVVRTYNECTATLLARLAPLGVTLLQHEVMMNLLRSPGLTQRALAERCFSAKSGVSMLLDRMQQDGLVTRDPHPDDSRARIIDLTEAGKRLARELAEMQAEVVEEMTSPYDTAELETLERLMDETAERLRQMREDLRR